MTVDSPQASEAVPVDGALSPFKRQRVLLAVLLLSAAFAVTYLVAANVILRTRVLRDLVSEGPDVELEYESAYSVWPGLVHVRGLELQVQDYGHQFAIAAESGQLVVSLHALLFKHFHVTSVSLTGLSYRFRDKLPAAELEDARVGAYPGIAGFPDPPALIGEEPPPVPDSEYDTWRIGLDEVHAELRELWFFEYRYRGGGVVTGGFDLLPGRYFAVYPARVSLQGGELSVGDTRAAARLALDLEGHFDVTDVRQTSGAAMLEKMSGQLAIDAHGVDLGALDSRAPAGQAPRVDGKGDLAVALGVERGVLVEQSTLQLDASELSVRTPLGRLSGSARSNLKTGPDGRIDWETTSREVALSRAARQPGPSLGNPRLALQLRLPTLAGPAELLALELDVPELRVPTLAWAERLLERAGTPLALRGQLEGRVHLSLARTRGPAARLGLRLRDAALSSAEVRASLDGRIDAELQPAAGEARSSAGRVDIELEGVEVGRADEKAKPLRAAVRLPDLRLSLEPDMRLSSGVDVFANPADSLLSIALGSSLLEELAANVLDLRRLEAQARINVSPRAVRFELARAESGALSGAGFWQRTAAGRPHGAFLISSDVANVGISLSGSETETAWFVADDWLSRARSGATQPAPVKAEARTKGGIKAGIKAGRRPAKRSDANTNASAKKR